LSARNDRGFDESPAVDADARVEAVWERIRRFISGLLKDG
jgi:hypothetical protein